MQSTYQSNLTVRRKIRVVHVLHSFGTGGMEKGIATLINNSSDIFEHIILCLSTSGESSRLLSREVQIYELNKPPGNSFLYLFKLAKALRTLRPGIVHTRNWGGMDGIIAARLAGIRSVMMTIMERIELNPKVCNGKPVIKGTRIPISVILEQIAQGESWDDLLKG